MIPGPYGERGDGHEMVGAEAMKEAEGQGGSGQEHGRMVYQDTDGLLDLLAKSSDDASKAAALSALANYNDDRIARAVLGQYAQMTEDLRSVAQGLLSSRKAWAKARART